MTQATQAKMKANSAKKKLDDYLQSDEYKQKQAERNQKANEQRLQQSIMDAIMGNPGGTQIQPEADPTETQLRAAYDQAQAEADAAENEEVMAMDLEAITGLSNEDRKLLEQYAVNQIRDQNLPMEMAGVMPTAQQEANPLIQKYGKQRVDELAETYMRQQNAELAQKVEESARQEVTGGFWNGVGKSLKTVPIAALSGVVGTVGQLQGAARHTGRYTSLDPNATGTIGDVYTGAIRGQVAQNIEGEDPTLLSKGLSIGYQGLMSAADSIARAYLGGGALGGAALAATGSFSQTMADASRQGATPAQAALLATATAGIEAASEKIPLDDLIKTAKGGGAASVLKNVFRQMGIEATTEEVSLLGSLLAEAAILQEKSGYQQTVTAQLMLGKSPEEAQKIAAQEIWEEVINTAAVSAVAGIGGGVSASYANEANLFAKNGASEAVNQPKKQTPEQMKQAAIENNRARHEAMVAEEDAQAPQSVTRPQTEAQPQVEVEEQAPLHQESRSSASPAAPVVDGAVPAQDFLKATGEKYAQMVPPETPAPIPEGLRDFDNAAAIANGIEPKQAQKTAAPEETMVNVKSAGTALTEQNKEKNTLAYTLASNIDSVRDMAPVSQLTGREFNDRSKKMTEQIRDFFKSLGNKVARVGFGDVSLGEYGIGGMMNHRPLNRSKMVSLAAVPDVIQNGRQIAYEPNWKGRGYETYTFAAPVTVSGTEVYVAAVVNRKPDNKFYLSEMVDSQGNYVRIEESPSGNSKYGVTDGAENSGKAGMPMGPEGLSEGSNPSTTTAEPMPLPINSIPANGEEVNGNSAYMSKDGTQKAAESLSGDAEAPRFTSENATKNPAAAGDVTQAPAESLSANHETNARSSLASPSSINSISESTPKFNGNSVNSESTPTTDTQNQSAEGGQDVLPSQPATLGRQNIPSGDIDQSRTYTNTGLRSADEDIRSAYKDTMRKHPDAADYQVKHNKDTLATAQERTATMEQVEAECDYLLKKTDWTAEDNVTAKLVVKQLYKSGNDNAAKDLLSLQAKIADINTRAGQISESNRILGTMEAATETETAVDSLPKCL